MHLNHEPRAAEAVEFVLASANPDKTREIRAILTSTMGDDIVLLPRPSHVPDVVEDGDTLTANARLKAAALCIATGLPAIADDTGLEVDALGGAPGVHSARYSGADATYSGNVAHLLTELERVGATSPNDRTARFRTVALVRYPDGSEVIGEGVVEGTITAGVVGADGFGYDPVFAPVDEVARGRTFAEMSAAEKHAISHRGRAFRQLARRLGAARPEE